VYVVAGRADGPEYALTGATRALDADWRAADAFFVVVAGAGG
jgi:hypothetical protein